MVGHGGSSASSYLADPTSPIPSHCASIVATSSLRLNNFYQQGVINETMFASLLHLCQYNHVTLIWNSMRCTIYIYLNMCDADQTRNYIICNHKGMHQIPIECYLQGDYVFNSNLVFVCLSVCLFVSNITQQVMNRLWWKFMEGFGVVKEVGACPDWRVGNDPEVLGRGWSFTTGRTKTEHDPALVDIWTLRVLPVVFNYVKISNWSVLGKSKEKV